jgi:Holliday junction resolvase RusA-like endonuclease
MIKINIKPLSVNQAWQGRRFKSDKYKSYEKAVLLLLPKSKKDYNGNLEVTIKYGFSSKLSDIDNPCKMILDCLCKKYGFDDRQIFELHQYKEIVKKGNDYFAFDIEQKVNKI